MVDIGKVVMVDFPDKPSLFLIKGYGEIRMQKSNTRINGVTKTQLETMIKALKPKKVKDEPEPDTTDVVKATPRKDRATGSKSYRSPKGPRHSA